MALKGKKPSEIIRPRKLKFCLFGKPNVGKTKLALQFPKVYYIDSENGAIFDDYLNLLEKGGGAYFGIDEGASDFSTVIQEVKTLATTKHDYQTVAITISKLWLNELGKAQEKAMVKNPDMKNDFGAFKRPAVSYMRQLMNWVQRIDMHFIFEAHEVPEWETMPNGERREVGAVPDYHQKMDHELSLTLRLIANPDTYCQVKKTRLAGFPRNEVFPCSYDEIIRRCGDSISFDTTPIVLATEKQIGKILELLETIKIDDKVIEGILSNAQAGDWTELNTEQAEATIKWLKGKIK